MLVGGCTCDLVSIFHLDCDIRDTVCVWQREAPARHLPVKLQHDVHGDSFTSESIIVTGGRVTIITTVLCRDALGATKEQMFLLIG
jgi:hypothetical protein